MSLRAKSNANFQRLPAQKGSYSGTRRSRFYSGETLYSLENGFSKLQNYCTKSFIIEPPKLAPTVTHFGFIFSENRWNVLKVGQHIPISYCPKGWASIYWTAEKCLNWQKNPYPNFLTRKMKCTILCLHNQTYVVLHSWKNSISWAKSERCRFYAYWGQDYQDFKTLGIRISPYKVRLGKLGTEETPNNGLIQLLENGSNKVLFEKSLICHFFRTGQIRDFFVEAR